jgi:hypothetical protein
VLVSEVSNGGQPIVASGINETVGVGLIVIVNAAVDAQMGVTVDVGVKVYVVVAVLSIAGDHVPVIPLVLVNERLGIIDPLQ